MSSFPSIQQPSYAISTTVGDNSIKSEMINGMVVSRPRYSRQLKKWELQWNGMPATDLGTLRTFYNTCFGGSVAFVWNDADDSNVAKSVRFDSDLVYSEVGANKNGRIYQVKISLREV